MNRKLILAISLAALLVGSAAGMGTAAYYNPVDERLVEGHTVFAVLQVVDAEAEVEEEYAAAVAVLVREKIQKVSTPAKRFPGVLWFNDQYLTNPTNSPEGYTYQTRFPCNGAVLAVQSGDPDPRVDGLAQFNDANYVESYRITDPNDKLWDIDKWLVNGTLIWSVALLNSQTKYSLDDDGSNCNPYSDIGSPSCQRRILQTEDYNPPAWNECAPSAAFCANMWDGCYVRNPGLHGYNHVCGGKDTHATCSALQYNALLYFRLDDLAGPSPMVKNHTRGSTNYSQDVAACAQETNTTGSWSKWPCPLSDDQREGNSHPYNPNGNYPFQKSVRAPHGGSDDCDNDGTPDEYCHATRDIDIYYGIAMAPSQRTYYIEEYIGSSAPYHCHDEIQYCTKSDHPVFSRV